LGRVFTLHGVAPRVQPRRSIYRNISDEATLTAILAAREPFVPLADALAGRGDALTVDDATRTAADAALLARRFGHAVTLFVNPSQVDPPVPYSFLLLSALLDGLRGHRVMLEGESFPTRSFRQRDVLRALLKEKLRDTPTEAERTSLIRALASEWRVGMLEIPRFLETLEVADLQRLLDAGVEIQNHGWSHTCHIRLDPSESAREIARGREWLSERLGIEARAFAVPYGDAMPHESTRLACDVWLTVDDRHPGGPIAPGVFNRDTLEAPPKRGPLEELRYRAERFVRRSKRRWPGLAKLGRGK
jgi:hypothetical protein